MQHALSSAGTSLSLEDSQGPRNQLAAPCPECTPKMFTAHSHVTFPDHSINTPLPTLPIAAPALSFSVSLEPS